MLEYEQSERLGTPAGSGRHLLMLQCSEKEFLPYCIQLLVACLKVCLGSRGSSVVEWQTPDSEVLGSSPGRRIFFSSVLGFRSRQENFLLQGQLSVLTLILVFVPSPCYCSCT